MRDHPIIFSGAMIKALIAGTKSQTRRIIKPQPQSVHDKINAVLKYRVRDRLWVRETFSTDGVVVRYAATDDIHEIRKKKPAIHMPRWASRLTLVVTCVKVERLNDISEEDAEAEGVEQIASGCWRDYDGIVDRGYPTARASFVTLWSSIHGEDAFESNPWVCAISFDTYHCNIDSMEKAA